MKFRHRHIPLVAVAVVAGAAMPPLEARAAQYTFTDLGAFAGGVSEAYGINSSGQIVGYSNTSTNGGFPHPHAFLYQNGVMKDLGSFGAQQFLSGDQSHAYGINDSGQIVGDSITVYNNGASLPTHAFLYSAGSMVDLGSLGTIPAFANSSARAINNSGQITGNTTTAGDPLSHAFSYANGTMIDLGEGALNTNSFGYAINSNGLIAGQAISSPSGSNHPFLFQGGNLSDLGSLLNSNSGLATGIDDFGDVVGQSNSRAFLYSAGAMTNLGIFPGDTSSEAFDINDKGEIVGSSSGSLVSTAFIYRNGIMTNLNLLTDSPFGWHLDIARGINDSGQIVGTASVGGIKHAFLLTPTAVPEPASLWVMALAGVALLIRRRHRAEPATPSVLMIAGVPPFLWHRPSK